jgi:FkbM family methyltransferase
MAEKMCRIGRFTLALPNDHMLDRYRAQYKLFDRALAEIARAIAGKYPDLTAVDIGANVGDSAALICEHQDVPVLCVEGNPSFLDYLRYNLAGLPRGIELVEGFVGAKSGVIEAASLRKSQGTSSVELDKLLAPEPHDRPNAQVVSVRTLSEILRSHPRFRSPRLIKSDTDGSDFDILRSSLDIVATCKAVLFFEYDPTFRHDGIKAGLELISLLLQIGYRYFLVYDNFGNLMSFVEDDVLTQFRNLTFYVMSHLLSGRQIYYLDVCAFAAEDEDLAVQVYEDHCEVLDRGVRTMGWELGAEVK